MLHSPVHQSDAFAKLTRESQDPVHKLMPSLLTPKQLTRFS